MTKRRLVAVLAILLTSLLIISCKKDNGDPTIKFVPGPGFTGKDTLIKVNHNLIVALKLTWNGADLLEQLEVLQNDMSVQTFAVEGDTTNFNLTLTKGPAETEKWSFVVKDVKGNQSSVSLTLTKDPNSEYGAIVYYSPVILGAQNNTAKANFISFQTVPATTYTLEGAFTNQSKIDMLFYSDQLTLATLASPGSDIPEDLYPGSRSINLWTLRPLTRFMKSTMTSGDFVSLSTDAGMVDGWKDAGSLTIAGNLKVDDVWLMKMQNGKLGAILVKRITAGDAGEIEFGIKVQQ
ncbi:MAG: hypothetical protein WC699_13945 [Bacteroidales bacterium]|jgi:hypothetical protein